MKREEAGGFSSERVNTGREIAMVFKSMYEWYSERAGYMYFKRRNL